MSRHVEVKPGKNLTIAGPANVHIKGGPTLSGTQPVPGTAAIEDNAGDENTDHHEPKHNKHNARHGK